MKKLNLLLCAALLIAGCKGSGSSAGGDSSASINDTAITNSVSGGDTAGTSRTAEKWTKTLDGIDRDKAGEWIKNFEASYNEAVGTPVNFFMSKEMIEKVVRLLQAERNTTPTGVEKPDGVRFYFAKETTGGPLRLLLISTRRFLLNSANPLKSHDDYYDHDSAEADELFKDLNALKMNSFDEKVDGADLYVKKNVVERRCNYQQNYISRKLAYEMVEHFKGGKMNTYSEFFPLELFETFLTDELLSGVRIYLGRHGEDHPFYPNRLALILCVTHNQDGIAGKFNEDYFTCSSLVEPSFKKGGEKDAYNNGHLCPTNCNVLPPPPPPDKLEKL